jgi:hypothetical protein
MNLPPAPAPIDSFCTVSTCRLPCALEVVDNLLHATGSVRGDEVDALLDLRSLLRHRQDASATLALFCQLRRGMESRHYLAFYRLRRWLENQVEAIVRVHRGDLERVTPVKLERYCMEAVRYQCLHSVLRSGEMVLAPKVHFRFRPLAWGQSPERESCISANPAKPV